MADLHVSWTDYHDSIEELGVKILDSGWRFNQILCVARGGLRVGDTLSRIFETPLAIMSTQSYRGEAGTVRGEITVAEHLTMTTPVLGDKVLVVDDLVDSGVTLDVVKRHMLRQHPTISELRTAVLWYKSCSTYEPDYYVHYLADSPWIHQPFEKYELMSPEQLRATRRP
ncbi:MAG: phosphoribosyltransferase [Betaproteobacteria bacterium]|nr:phosphoribosyltransferase [Betaproteobacteria bacterium]